MQESILLILLVVFVGLTALAVLLQAIFLIRMAKAVHEIRDLAERLSGQLDGFLGDTRERLDQVQKQLAGVIEKSTDTIDQVQSLLKKFDQSFTEIAGSIKQQLAKVDEVISDATTRAKKELEKAELIVDDTLHRFHEVSDLLYRGVTRPLREIAAVVAGVQSAMAYLFRSRRPAVSRATQDEEMFI